MAQYSVTRLQMVNEISTSAIVALTNAVYSFNNQLFAQPFIQVQIKGNIKAPCHWPLCGEFTGDCLIPRTEDQGIISLRSELALQSELAFSITIVCRKLASFSKKLARFLRCFTKLLAFFDPEKM